MILLPLKDNIIIKTENRPVKKTLSGIVYDEQFEKSDIRYGHVYSIRDDDSEKYKLVIGDRVAYILDYANEISYKSTETQRFIGIVLMAVHPNGILCKTPEESTLMDY